jgi:hypothetical protein
MKIPASFGAIPAGSIANHLTPFSHSTGIDTDSKIESTLRGGSDLHPIGLHFREGSGNARKAKKLARAGALEIKRRGTVVISLLALSRAHPLGRKR